MLRKFGYIESHGGKVYHVVRIPKLSWGFYDRERGRVVSYGEIMSKEDVKRLKVWLKEHGYKYDQYRFEYYKEMWG